MATLPKERKKVMCGLDECLEAKTMTLLLLSLGKKLPKMENLSYFNLNSTEDCGKRGRVTSFVTSTFDQFS